MRFAAENLQKPVILRGGYGGNERHAASGWISDSAAVLRAFLAAIEIWQRLVADPATMLAGYRDLARMCGFNEPEAVRAAVAGSGSCRMAAKPTSVGRRVDRLGIGRGVGIWFFSYRKYLPTHTYTSTQSRADTGVSG